jgi:hypothetical protein
MKWRYLIVVVTAGAIAGIAAAQPENPPALLALTKINTPNYTGGLSRAHRAIAHAIHDSMKSRYRRRCGDVAQDVTIIQAATDKRNPPRDNLKDVDPALAFLIRTLDDPRQEVRDLAAYTIGLLGPDAKAAQPILTARFSDDDAKGGWYHSALKRVSCENYADAEITRTIPDALLPPGAHITSWDKDDDKSYALVLSSSRITRMLVPRLYLDPDIEYPPGTLRKEYEDAHPSQDDSGPPVPHLPLLVQIVEDKRLSAQKHTEAAFALSRMPRHEAKRVLPVMIRLSETAFDELKFIADRTLVTMRHERGIPILVGQIREGTFFPYWEQDLCAYGPTAIAAEDKLMTIAQNAQAPSFARAGVRALGCIRSSKSVPLLTRLLKGPDWQIAALSAVTLGSLQKADPSVIDALTSISRTHWSGIVRQAATRALAQISGQKISAQPLAIERTGEMIIGAVGAFDHRLPRCDEQDEFSVDGKTWFDRKWNFPERMAPPRGFAAANLLQPIGDQIFVAVYDGWLVGSDGFEGTGVLAHVSQTGKTRHLDNGISFNGADGDATVRHIFRHGKSYIALGYQILTVGEAGVLWQIDQGPDQAWRAQRKMILPSAPVAYMLGPNGELVIGDMKNTYAVVGERIAPLKCRYRSPKH